MERLRIDCRNGRNVVVLLLLLFPGMAGGEEPNFILIMADDLGWGDTGYNGSKHAQTPELDAMAQNGLTFNRFYAAAPVCSPTRGSCLTGRHPYRYGIFFANTGHLKREESTLGEYLQSKGYRTGHFGKWHLGTLTTTLEDSNRGGPRGKGDFSTPAQNGFDVSFSTEAKVPTFDPLIKPPKASGKYWLPIGDRQKAVPYGTRYWENGTEVKAELRGDDSEIIMDRAIHFVERNRKEKFLAVIWFHAPHLPVVASDRDRREFSAMDPYSQSYFGCIRALDRQVGRLRQKLRELDIAGRTMVCFCSDNGPEGNAKAPGSGGQLRGRKRSLYEGGVRVPGIVEWPERIRPGSVTDYPAVTSDYLPTIVDVTGGSMPARPLDGVSLKGVFSDPAKVRKSPIFFESRNMASVVEQQFKLVASVSRNDEKLKDPELYDLASDPSEKNNLAAMQTDRVLKMKKSLAAWRRSCRKSQAGNDYQP
ncbi:MAG: sulfatase-like hydrolase/transferase [Planctomycetota bacterium]|nr:sulfatase-like hydrolase/transferase [Planctomycetota bacterium]